MNTKEAIERIKTRFDKWALDNEDTEAIQTLIPELAENEDERIRKEINILYSDIDTCISELLKARTDKDSEAEGKALFKMEGLMVATLQDLSCIENYLEKQKDQKHLSTEETELNSIAFLEQLGYTCVPPGAEQKPADDEAKAIAYREYERGRESGLRDGQKYVLDNAESYGLCKPVEWSKEDNIGWDEAFACVTLAEKAAKNEEELQNAVTAEKWLKEIKFKYYVHPVKQEWSEEDKNNLELVIDCIYKFYPDPVMKYKLKEWLKSLRPSKDCSDCAKHLEGYISGRIDAENKLLEQFGALITPEDELHIKPRWKPSEEQIKALQMVKDSHCFMYQKDRVAIEKLLEQIKSL